MKFLNSEKPLWPAHLSSLGTPNNASPNLRQFEHPQQAQQPGNLEASRSPVQQDGNMSIVHPLVKFDYRKASKSFRTCSKLLESVRTLWHCGAIFRCFIWQAKFELVFLVTLSPPVWPPHRKTRVTRSSRNLKGHQQQQEQKQEEQKSAQQTATTTIMIKTTTTTSSTTTSTTTTTTTTSAAAAAAATTTTTSTACFYFFE